MAGHSKWAGIKHKKAIVDARRGKLFTKLARHITVAAKDVQGLWLNAPQPTTDLSALSWAQ